MHAWKISLTILSRLNIYQIGRYSDERENCTRELESWLNQDSNFLGQLIEIAKHCLNNIFGIWHLVCSVLYRSEANEVDLVIYFADCFIRAPQRVLCSMLHLFIMPQNQCLWSCTGVHGAGNGGSCILVLIHISEGTEPARFIQISQAIVFQQYEPVRLPR